jgi:metal-responsive CopG/Arc/MetJ family transcriptional regulator
MKKKVGTVIDEELLRQVKLVAARDDVQLAQVFEDALRQYLQRKTATSQAARSRGALRAPPELVRTVLEDEEGFLDA